MFEIIVNNGPQQPAHVMRVNAPSFSEAERFARGLLDLDHGIVVGVSGLCPWKFDRQRFGADIRFELANGNDE